ncbi:MAG: triose-phosphate isomerase [Deltaproteobacteria bacterium]|nr:triose-phosphate isomerase [Deltaproteobacteria bacterium]
MNRIPLIAGNWKMNMTLYESKGLVLGIHYAIKYPHDVEVVVAPPFTAISFVSGLVRSSYIEVAAQDISTHDAGAFTGEISGSMIRGAGCRYVIVGHSERRQYFFETDDLINQKMAAARTHKLIPILCVGETLIERERGACFNVVERQLAVALSGLQTRDPLSLVIAYEPVWAIGTGRTATLEQINEMHAFIRSTLAGVIDPVFASQVRVLYGGSVNSKNSAAILSLGDVDGALIGGASLRVAEFVSIIKSATNN